MKEQTAHKALKDGLYYHKVYWNPKGTAKPILESAIASLIVEIAMMQSKAENRPKEQVEAEILQEISAFIGDERTQKE